MPTYLGQLLYLYFPMAIKSNRRRILTKCSGSKRIGPSRIRPFFGGCLGSDFAGPRLSRSTSSFFAWKRPRMFWGGWRPPPGPAPTPGGTRASRSCAPKSMPPPPRGGGAFPKRRASQSVHKRLMRMRLMRKRLRLSVTRQGPALIVLLKNIFLIFFRSERIEPLCSGWPRSSTLSSFQNWSICMLLLMLLFLWMLMLIWLLLLLLWMLMLLWLLLLFYFDCCWWRCCCCFVEVGCQKMRIFGLKLFHWFSRRLRRFLFIHSPDIALFILLGPIFKNFFCHFSTEICTKICHDTYS